MKKTGKTLTSAVAGIALSGLLMATATGCHRQRRPDPQDFELVEKIATWKLNQFLDRIDATDKQRREFHDAKDWLLDEIQLKAEQRKVNHREILEAFKQDEPDAEKLHNILDARINEHRAFAHDVLDTILHLHAQLTPKQRQMLLKFVEDRMGRFHNKGPGGFFGGRGGSGFARRHGHGWNGIKHFFKSHFSGDSR